MAKNINVRINDEQELKIKKSGLTRSEFVRRAIDVYELSKSDIEKQAILQFIEKCKEYLYKEEQFVKNVKKVYNKPSENVKKCKTNQPIMTGNVKNIFTKQQENQENVVQKDCTNFTNLMQNVKNVQQINDENTTIETDPLTLKLGKYVVTLAKLNYTETHGEPRNNEALKNIASQCRLSKGTVEDYIFHHKDEFRQYGTDWVTLEENVKKIL